MISQMQKDRDILAGLEMSVDEKEKFGLFYDQYKKFGVASVDGKNSLMTIETNWNEATQHNQYLRLKFGDEEMVIRNEDLRTILKLIAPLEEAEQMLAHSKRFYTRKDYLVKVKASRPYHRGEEITLQLNLPERIM